MEKTDLTDKMKEDLVKLLTGFFIPIKITLWQILDVFRQVKMDEATARVVIDGIDKVLGPQLSLMLESAKKAGYDMGLNRANPARLDILPGPRDDEDPRHPGMDKDGGPLLILVFEVVNHVTGQAIRIMKEADSPRSMILRGTYDQGMSIPASGSGMKWEIKGNYDNFYDALCLTTSILILNMFDKIDV